MVNRRDEQDGASEPTLFDVTRLWPVGDGAGISEARLLENLRSFVAPIAKFKNAPRQFVWQFQRGPGDLHHDWRLV